MISFYISHAVCWKPSAWSIHNSFVESTEFSHVLTINFQISQVTSWKTLPYWETSNIFGINSYRHWKICFNGRLDPKRLVPFLTSLFNLISFIPSWVKNQIVCIKIILFLIGLLSFASVVILNKWLICLMHYFFLWLFKLLNFQTLQVWSFSSLQLYWSIDSFFVSFRSFTWFKQFQNLIISLLVVKC